MGDRNNERYSPRKLERCLHAIKSVEVKSQRAAAKLFDIPQSTIVSKLNGKQPMKKCKRGPDPTLGIENEDKLHQWILSCCKRGFPIRVSDLVYTVESVIRNLPLASRRILTFKKVVPQKSWYYKFLNRHPIISIKKAEYLSACRANVSKERIRNWFAHVESLLQEGVKEVLNDPRRIFNCDETAIWLNPSNGCVLTKKGEAAYAVSTNEKTSNSKRLDDRSCVSVSHKEVFDRYLKAKKIQKPVILFVDGHVSHLSIAMTDYCFQNGTVPVCLLAFTTHFLQTLDLSVFKLIKEAWKIIAGRFRFTEGCDPVKYKMAELIDELIRTYNYNLQSSVINGFHKAGLFPWNVEAPDYTKCQFLKERTLG